MNAQPFSEEQFQSRWNESPMVLAGATRPSVALTPRSAALTMPFIEVNVPDAPNIMVLELICPDGDAREVVAHLVNGGALPPYSYVIYRKNFQGAVIAYLVKRFVSTKKSRSFFSRTQMALLITLEAHGTSRNRIGSVTPNPLSSSFIVEWGSSHEYELKELNVFADAEVSVELYKARDMPPFDSTAKNARAYLFTAARRWAYTSYRKEGLNAAAFKPKLATFLQTLNAQFDKPATDSQLEGIASDILAFVQANITAEERPEFIAAQVARSSNRKVVQAAPSRWAAALELHESGLSNKEIAALGTYGKTTDAVRKLLVRAKAARGEAVSVHDMMEEAAQTPAAVTALPSSRDGVPAPPMTEVSNGGQESTQPPVGLDSENIPTIEVKAPERKFDEDVPILDDGVIIQYSINEIYKDTRKPKSLKPKQEPKPIYDDMKFVEDLIARATS